MKISPTISQISFGYSTVISRLWKDGKLPITKGLYGGILTKQNVSNEHILPKSKGGTSKLRNIALATKENNNKRSNSLLSDFLTKENFEAYCQQFENLSIPYKSKDKIKFFDGNKYIKDITETVNTILQEEKKINLLG